MLSTFINSYIIRQRRYKKNELSENYDSIYFVLIIESVKR